MGRVSQPIEMKPDGFALIEVLVALSIISTVIISIYGALFNGITILKKSGDYTRALFIARNSYHTFLTDRMRGTDLNEQPVDGYEGFLLSRSTVRFEHPLLASLPAKKTTFTVSWKEDGKMKTFSMSTIYLK